MTSCEPRSALNCTATSIKLDWQLVLRFVKLNQRYPNQKSNSEKHDGVSADFKEWSKDAKERPKDVVELQIERK
jgi:hypothetical protein